MSQLIIRNLPEEVKKWCKDKSKNADGLRVGAESYVRHLLISLYELETGDLDTDPNFIVEKKNKYCPYDPDFCPECTYFPCTFRTCRPLIQNKLPLN